MWCACVDPMVGARLKDGRQCVVYARMIRLSSTKNALANSPRIKQLYTLLIDLLHTLHLFLSPEQLTTVPPHPHFPADKGK